MDDFIPVGGIIVLLMLTGGIIGGCCAQQHHQREAVKHGAATWEVHDDGSTTFKWKGE